jgi:hypothetical protein
MRTVLVLLLAACGSSPEFMPMAPNDLSMSGTSTGGTTGGTTGSTTGGTTGGMRLDGGTPDMSQPPKPSPSPGTGCGTCPSGTLCSSANGIPVCKTPSNVPLFTSVFVVVMENTSLGSLQGASNTPYLSGLFTKGAFASDYHGVTHPSLPNYIALTSGSPGVQSDGTTAVSCDCDPSANTCDNCSVLTTLISPCGCEQTTQHLGDLVELAGKSWKDYGQSMGSACNTNTSGAYAARHVPFLYYDNVQSNTTRCNNHIVDYSVLAGDLTGTTPNLAFIAPDLNNDMHGTGILQSGTDVGMGDTWLHDNVGAPWLMNNTGKITDSAAFKAGGVVFIVWDEDDLSGTLSKDDPIPLFVISPFAKTGGYNSVGHADHYALLATIQDGLGLKPRLGGAGGAATLGDFFAEK